MDRGVIAYFPYIYTEIIFTGAGSIFIYLFIYKKGGTHTWLFEHPHYMLAIFIGKWITY